MYNICILYIVYILQELLLVSWHCLSWAVQTRPSPPLREAGDRTQYQAVGESNNLHRREVMAAWWHQCDVVRGRLRRCRRTARGPCPGTSPRMERCCFVIICSFYSQKQVRRDDSCLDWTGQQLLVLTCHGQRGNQQWSFSNSTLLHRYFQFNFQTEI